MPPPRRRAPGDSIPAKSEDEQEPGAGFLLKLMGVVSGFRHAKKAAPNTGAAVAFGRPTGRGAIPRNGGAEMDRKLKSFSTSSDSASPPRALKSLIAVAIAVGLIAGAAFPAAVSSPGAAKTVQPAVSVNRTNKGDRLPLTLKRTSTISSPAAATQARPPVGCDPAFSRVADPARAHIFGRCIS